MTRTNLFRSLVAGCASVLLVGGVGVGSAAANPVPRLAAPAPAVSAGADNLALTVPGTGSKPAYEIRVGLDPFKISTIRGGKVVMATASSGVSVMPSSGSSVHTTHVVSANFQNNKMVLTVATGTLGATVKVTLAPAAGQYVMTLAPSGATPKSIGLAYDLTAAGHWYGNGEATTPAGGPYTNQPWPLDFGTVTDPEFSAASYNMDEPFWFTQTGAGLSVATQNNMTVSIGDPKTPHRAVFGVDDAATFTSTVYVGHNA